MLLIPFAQAIFVSFSALYPSAIASKVPLESAKASIQEFDELGHLAAWMEFCPSCSGGNSRALDQIWPAWRGPVRAHAPPPEPSAPPNHQDISPAHRQVRRQIAKDLAGGSVIEDLVMADDSPPITRRQQQQQQQQQDPQENELLLEARRSTIIVEPTKPQVQILRPISVNVGAQQHRARNEAQQQQMYQQTSSSIDNDLMGLRLKQNQQTSSSLKMPSGANDGFLHPPYQQEFSLIYPSTPPVQSMSILMDTLTLLQTTPYNFRTSQQQQQQQQQQADTFQMSSSQQEYSGTSSTPTSEADCVCQMSSRTTRATLNSHEHDEDDECKLQCGRQMQLTSSGSFISSSASLAPTTPLPSLQVGSGLATSSSSHTSSSAAITTTSTTGGNKMNPLDVTFLLYTRYHRDLARLAAAAAAASSSSSTSSAPSSTSSSTGQQQQQAVNQQESMKQSQGQQSNKIDAKDSPKYLHIHHHHHCDKLADYLVEVSDVINPINNDTQAMLMDDNRPFINGSLPIKIIIHGFGSGGRRRWVTDMVCKLLDYEDVNVIVVDWEKGAALLNYVQAAGNTRLVGHKIANLIKSINAKYGITGNSYHLIGFSLGAHVAGFTGMEIRNSTSVPRHWINRITGLDPASLLFEGYEANDRLDPSDAQFVDVIHSNGDGVLRGGFGSLQPMGHVDFYPNGGRVQVGCNSALFAAFSDIIYQSDNWKSLCNHRRALYFFMDSFEFNRCRFRSFNCDSYESFLRGDCFECGQNSEKCSYMGYLANYSKGRGKMYLTTHEEAPFCANQFIIKVIGSKGYKTHWGKIEVTLVTSDGKNESFWLTSLSSVSGAASSSHNVASSTQTNNANVHSNQSLSLVAAGHGHHHHHQQDNVLASAASNTAGLTSSAPARELQQQSMQSLIVAHPTLMNFTHVLLRYTRYKGWIYSGDESWPIDKVLLMDSDGQVKSFCGHNTILESHITSRLNLEPGNCTVLMDQQQSQQQASTSTLLNSMGRQTSSSSSTTSQPQMPEQSIGNAVINHHAASSALQSIGRQPRLLASIMHQPNGATTTTSLTNEANLNPSEQMQVAASVSGVQPMLISQHQAYSRHLNPIHNQQHIQQHQLHHVPLHKFSLGSQIPIQQPPNHQQQHQVSQILAF